MSTIVSDPEAVKFVREVVRPLAERSRALIYQTRSALAKWKGNPDYNVTGVSALIPDIEGYVDENRGSEGISNLSLENLNSIMRGLEIAEQAYDDGLMEKACVRTLGTD